MKATYKILASLGGMILLVLVGVSCSLQALRQIERASEQRKHAFVELSRANTFLSALKDSETGYRGYLLTQDEAFLEPYLMVRDTLGDRLAELRQPNLGEAARRHLDTVVPLVSASLANMSQGIGLSRRHDLSHAVMTFQSGQGKQWMDQIRAEMTAFIASQEDELAQQDAGFRARMRQMLWVIGGTSLFTLVFALLFAYLFYRESQRRLKNLIYHETKRLLDVQTGTNEQLRIAYATLQESEEKLAVTFGSIGDGVLTTDAAGRLTGLNSVAEQLTGWPLAEAMGRPVDEVFRVINQETRQPSTVPVKETLEKGTVHGLANHTVLLARRGGECAIADSCAPIRDRDGRVVGAIMVFRDVSSEYAQRQVLRDTEERLRWTEESFRLMVESVQDFAIVMLDPEGRVLTWNSGAQRINGFTPGEIIGQDFSRFYLPADIQAGRPGTALAAATAEGRFKDEGWRVRRDGSAFWASIVLTSIRDQDGLLRGFAKLTQDLTERRRVERELQEAKALAENANLAKSNFLSSMSHELRSPLNAILGFAQLMETDTPPPRPGQLASIAQILKAGWHLLTLINEILDLSRVESGQVPMSREPVSLTEVLGECRAMIEPQAGKRGITLRFPQSSRPSFVLADRTRVKQVLINLLSNAIKYNVQDGAVEVLCQERAPGRVRVTIRDTGRGLDPGQVAQLFQPFNRLGQEAGGEEGTGIGLVVAKRLIELMEGTIGVESAVGEGSGFWFELHAAAAPELAADAGSEAPDRLGVEPGAPVRSVLYVEDNPANLSLVEQILARYPDLRLLSERDGTSGVERARAVLPNVILMDINLPGISGYQALERLRADPATAHIPVIALSANAMTSDIERGLKAGFFRYLTKPINLNEFMDALKLALAGGAVSR